MRRYQADEFSRRYHLGFLPKPGEMLLISGDQVVRPSCVGTFEEYVVVGIARNFQTMSRSHDVTVILNELQQLEAKAPANPQLKAGEHVAVLLQDGPGNIQSRRLGQGKQQHSTLQPSRLDGGGNQQVCVDDKTERKHYRFGF
jgi:hypothetical protein